MLGQACRRHHEARWRGRVLGGAEGNREPLRGWLGTQDGAVQVPPRGHPPPVHGQKGKQGQLAHIDLQVGRTLEMHEGSHPLVRLSRWGSAERGEERSHQQRRGHGEKAVHPHVEHTEAGVARLHDGQPAGGGESGLSPPEHGPRPNANQAILDLDLRAEKAVPRQARLFQKPSQIIGIERHLHLAQLETMLLEAGDSSRQIEREAQVRDLQFQPLHPAKPRDVLTGQAEQASSLDEGKSECPFSASHDPPLHHHCRTGGRGVHRR